MPKKFHHQDPHYEREKAKYDAPVPSREWILQVLEQQSKGLTHKQLHKRFALYDPDAQEALRRRLIAMCRDGQLREASRGRFVPVESLPTLEGRVLVKWDGSACVQVAGDPVRYQLTRRASLGLMGGDQVKILPHAKTYRGYQYADVIAMVEPRQQTIVGRIMKTASGWMLKPFDRSTSDEVLLEGETLIDGSYGIASLLQRPSKKHQAKARIVELLGDEKTPGIEAKVCLAAHGISDSWHQGVEEEAASCFQAMNVEAYEKRRDLRGFPFVTIDGSDAKDFDDAVYAESSPEGTTLWVAIADVSHFVHEGSALDQEASRRGNSIYLPHRVVPMLPEVLANDLCSLKPEVDRLVMVCEMHLDTKGHVKHFEIYEGVIHSAARLTYQAVSDWLAQSQVPSRSYDASLLVLHELSLCLLENRRQRGALDFASHEMGLELDDHQLVTDLHKIERLDTHRLIEECMLLTNVCVAHYCLQHQLIVPNRIHESPDPKKLHDLRLFLQHYGLKLPGGDQPTPQDYADLIETTKAYPHAAVCQSIILRSLKQAVYAPESKGHFGLAYEHYLHFTSPIRRYPDLLVHRAIKSRWRQNSYHEESICVASEHCSQTERQADRIAREVQDWMLTRFMEPHLGSTFSAVVVSVNTFGFFVAIEPWGIEGLVHVKDLQGGFYHFDAASHQLHAEGSGHTIALGDELQVQCTRVSVDDRQIDFMPVQMQSKKVKKIGKKKGKSRRSKR